ncbi:MAG: hypothetical protein RL368_1658 [Pseudomonadota bacterium]|jgi:hypothetical protein
MKKLFLQSAILTFAVILQIALYFETDFYHIEIIWIILLGAAALEVPLLGLFIFIQFFKGWRTGKNLDEILSNSADALISAGLIITAIDLFVLIDAEEPYFRMTEWGTSVVIVTLAMQFWSFQLLIRFFRQWKLTKKLKDFAYLISTVQVNHLLIMVTAYYCTDVCKFRAMEKLNWHPGESVHFTECVRAVF